MPGWPGLEGILVGGPSLDPAGHKGPRPPCHWESTAVAGSARSEARGCREPHWEGKVTVRSGSLTGTPECSCSDWLAASW